jgi:ABC-type cobalamin/Fe3+-siderophores transport system ATPase subunit
VRRYHAQVTRLLDIDDPERGCLRLEDGQRVALLGASASGKTQLLRSVLGLGGDVRLSNVSRRGTAPTGLSEIVGWVPQQGGIFSDLSVLDNVARAPHTMAIDDRVAMDALDLLALSARARDPVRVLSAGELRRVALARAIARRAPLLVIDGDLDATLAPLLPSILDLLPHVRGVLTAGCTANHWAWMADSVVLVEAGRAVAQAPLSELASSRDPAVRSVVTWVMPSPE